MPFLMSFGEAKLASSDDGSKLKIASDFGLEPRMETNKGKENNDPNPAVNYSPFSSSSVFSSSSSEDGSTVASAGEPIFENSIRQNDDEAFLGQTQQQQENGDQRGSRQEDYKGRSGFMDPSPYFQHLEEVHKEYVEKQKEYMERQKEYIEKLYHNTVDGPCQTVSMCDARMFEDQLDLFSNCHQPLSFLPFFHEGQQKVVHEGVVEVLPPGAYVVPKFCEYCGSPSTALCKEVPAGRCQRPKLYFQKKRPPFAKKDPKRWDSKTDHEIKPLPTLPPPEERIPNENNPRRSSWVQDLFGGSK